MQIIKTFTYIGVWRGHCWWYQTYMWAWLVVWIELDHLEACWWSCPPRTDSLPQVDTWSEARLIGCWSCAAWSSETSQQKWCNDIRYRTFFGHIFNPNMFPTSTIKWNLTVPLETDLIMRTTKVKYGLRKQEITQEYLGRKWLPCKGLWRHQGRLSFLLGQQSNIVAQTSSFAKCISRK